MQTDRSAEGLVFAKSSLKKKNRSIVFFWYAKCSEDKVKVLHVNRRANHNAKLVILVYIYSQPPTDTSYKCAQRTLESAGIRDMAIYPVHTKPDFMSSDWTSPVTWRQINIQRKRALQTEGKLHLMNCFELLWWCILLLISVKIYIFIYLSLFWILSIIFAPATVNNDEVYVHFFSPIFTQWVPGSGQHQHTREQHKVRKRKRRGQGF